MLRSVIWKVPGLVNYFFKGLFIFLERKRGRVRGGRSRRGKERTSSRFHTQCRARRRTGSHAPRSWLEPKSWIRRLTDWATHMPCSPHFKPQLPSSQKPKRSRYCPWLADGQKNQTQPRLHYLKKYHSFLGTSQRHFKGPIMGYILLAETTGHAHLRG